MKQTKDAEPIGVPPTDPQVADLRAFAAIHETGSFSRAAIKLGITQPTVSIRLRNLEEYLGFKLIDRQQGSALTPMGQPVLSQVKLVLAQLDAFADTARGLDDLRMGLLRVGFSTPPQAMALIGTFRQQIPGVELSLLQSDTWTLIEQLKQNKIDVAIMTMAAPPSEQFSGVLVEQQTLAAMVPAGHDLDAGPPVSWKRLLDEPLLLRRAPSLTLTQIEREAARHGLSLDPFLELPSREAIKEAVAARMGVGIAFASEIGHDSRISKVEIANAETVNAVYVVGRAELSGLPAIAAFLDCARQYAGTVGN